MDKLKVYEMNALSLAYIGDAVYSLRVREKILKDFNGNLNFLNKLCNKIVCAKNQAKIFELMKDNLTDIEQDIARRARNAHYNNIAKHSTLEEYSKATMIEAVVGFLYLTENNNRLNYIFDIIFKEFL